jgi:hypothetical protein
MAQRIRLIVEWALALLFSPPLSKLDLNTEKEMLFRYTAVEALETEGAPPAKPHPR